MVRAEANSPGGEPFVISSYYEGDKDALGDSNRLVQTFSTHIKTRKILQLPLIDKLDVDTTHTYITAVKENVIIPLKEDVGKNNGDVNGTQEITIIWHLVAHGQHRNDHELWLAPTDQTLVSESRGLNFSSFERSLEDFLCHELPNSIRYNILYLIDSCQAGYAIRGVVRTTAYALATPKNGFAFVRPSWTWFFCESLTAKVDLARGDTVVDVKAVVDTAIQEGDKMWKKIYNGADKREDVVFGPSLWKVKVDGGAIFMSTLGDVER